MMKHTITLLFLVSIMIPLTAGCGGGPGSDSGYTEADLKAREAIEAQEEAAAESSGDFGDGPVPAEEIENDTDDQ